jgi:hypothetical protein
MKALLKQNKHSKKQDAMTPKKWDEISYHSPLSEENRDRIRHAIRKGHESVWCDLNQRESDWLEYIGFVVNGGEVTL